jgi:hypothetical protein
LLDTMSRNLESKSRLALDSTQKWWFYPLFYIMIASNLASLFDFYQQGYDWFHLKRDLVIPFSS